MNKTRKYHFQLMATLLLTSVLAGCSIREDHADCPRPFRLYLKAIDVDKTDITETGQVKEAVLFVFNEDKKLMEIVELNEQQIRSRQPINIAVEYPGHQSLTFFAWGNIDDDVELTTSGSGEDSDILIKLRGARNAKSTRQITKAGNIFLTRTKEVAPKSSRQTVEAPSDLFQGKLLVPLEYGGLENAGDQTVVIERKTSQVAIQALGLKAWNGNQTGEYTFMLHATHNTYNLDGELTGESVTYIPLATMNENGHCTTNIFRSFPTRNNESYELQILYNGKVIYTAKVGTDGKPFVPQIGKLLNIIIDFRAELSVQAVITPWDVVYQYVEI